MSELLVMGAAIVHEGRLLAARRTAPESARGRWELPGGKVEPGEDPRDAVVREVAEELGCTVRATHLLEGSEPVGSGLTLRVAVAELVAGEPVPHEHDAIRWLRHDELGLVDWLEPDLPFLPAIAPWLDGVADLAAGR